MNDLELHKPNIEIEFKAIKKFKKTQEGKLVETKWIPEKEWISKYSKICYCGNPMDKNIQTKVHRIYNSLTPQLQDEWLEKTSGLGWSHEYIKIALNYWNKQGKYVNTDKEKVNEYLTTLTDLERENFKDICEVFCPDQPYIHIKNTCGFLEYEENKQKINNYIKQLSQENVDKLDNDTDDMGLPERYHYILNSNEYKEYLASL